MEDCNFDLVTVETIDYHFNRIYQKEEQTSQTLFAVKDHNRKLNNLSNTKWYFRKQINQC